MLPPDSREVSRKPAPLITAESSRTARTDRRRRRTLARIPPRQKQHMVRVKFMARADALHPKVSARGVLRMDQA